MKAEILDLVTQFCWNWLSKTSILLSKLRTLGMLSTQKMRTLGQLFSWKLSFLRKLKKIKSVCFDEIFFWPNKNGGSCQNQNRVLHRFSCHCLEFVRIWRSHRFLDRSQNQTNWNSSEFGNISRQIQTLCWFFGPFFICKLLCVFRPYLHPIMYTFMDAGLLVSVWWMFNNSKLLH